MNTQVPPAGLARYLTAAFVIFGFAALPFIFSYDFAFNPHYRHGHIPGRMKTIAIYELLAVALILLTTVRPRDVFAPLGTAAWGLISLLALIAFSKIYLDVGEERLTFERSLMWVFHGVFGLTLVAYLRMLSDTQRLYTVVAMLCIGSLGYMGWVFTQQVLNAAQLGAECNPIMPGFKNVRYTGYFASSLCALLFGLLIQKDQNTVHRAGCLVFGIFALLYIAYTGSRGAFVSFLVTVLVYAMVLGRDGIRMILLALFACLVVFGLMMILPAPTCGGFNIFARAAAMDDLSVGAVSSGRSAIWAMVWDLYLQRPWFGHGEIGLRNALDVGVTQAHNSILQALLAWGAVGSLCFWGLVAMVGKGIITRSVQNPITYAPYVMGLVCLLVYSLIDATLYYSYPLLFATVLTAACVASGPSNPTPVATGAHKPR